MTYSLPEIIGKINGPVILVIDGQETVFADGSAAVQQKYEKWYLVEKMFVRNDEIVVCLKENDKINDTDWCGEERASFF